MSVRYLGINYLGYGIIPRCIMMDKNISINGKALYAYFCAFSGAGVTTIPHIVEICKHLNFDDKTFQNAMKELDNNKYLSYIMQDENTVNITLHNNIQITGREPLSKNDYKTINDMIKKQIKYDLLEQEYSQSIKDKEMIDEILVCICEMWYADSISANGTNYGADVVRDRIKKIDEVIMRDIIEQLSYQKKGKRDQYGVSVIHNPRNYLKAMIFNAVGKSLNDKLPYYS